MIQQVQMHSISQVILFTFFNCVTYNKQINIVVQKFSCLHHQREFQLCHSQAQLLAHHSCPKHQHQLLPLLKAHSYGVPFATYFRLVVLSMATHVIPLCMRLTFLRIRFLGPAAGLLLGRMCQWETFYSSHRVLDWPQSSSSKNPSHSITSIIYGYVIMCIIMGTVQTKTW